MTEMTGGRRTSTIEEATLLSGAQAKHTVGLQQGACAVATSPTIDRQTFTVEEAATLLGIGRNSAYQAIARGELPALRLGRRLLVPRAALERHLAESGAVERDAPRRRRS